MRHSKEQLRVHTLQDVVSLLKAGDRCVICVPAGENPILRSLNTGSSGLRNYLSILPFELPDEKSQKSVAKTLSLEKTISAKSAIKLLKAKLGRVPKRTVIIIDVSQHDRSWWKLERERIKFLEEATRIITKTRFRSLWLISRQAIPSSKIASIKDQVQFFFDISRIGTVYVGQFLTAKSIYEPDFFLPRIVSWGKGEFVMKNTLIPFSNVENATSPASSSPPVIQDLLEHQYREILEAARDGIVVFDVHGGHRELNKRGCEILGYTKEELRNLRLSDLVPADRYRSALRSLAILRAKGSLSVDSTIQKKSKRLITINLNASALKQGLFVGVFRDVTDSVKDVERLAESKEEYRRLIESAPFPTAIFANRKLSLGNHAFRKLFSWINTDENSPATMSDVFGKQNHAFIKDLNTRPMPADEIRREASPTVTVSTPSGEQMVLEVSAFPVSYKGKQGIQCAFINITDRNRIVQELEASRLRFEHLFQKSPNPIAVVRESKFDFVNQAFVSTFGYATASELVDKDVSTVLGKRFEKQMIEPGGPKGRSDDVRVVEFNFSTKKNELLYFEAQIVTTTFSGATALVLYFHDITQRKHAGGELETNAKSLELLRHVSNAINKTTSFAEQSSIALHSTMKGLGFEVGAVYGMENDSSLVALSHQGLSEKALDTLRRQTLQEGFMGYVNKTQEPLLLSIADYPPYLPYRALFESEKLQLVAVIPLISKGTLHGMMMLGTGRRKVFESFQRAVLMSVGETIGTAMERAVAYSRVVASESRYRSAVENISDVIYHATASGALTYLSPNVERLLGYTRETFFETADLWRTILHPDDRPKYGQRISNQAQASNDFHLEYRILPKGKAAYRWVRDSIRYMRDAEGNVISMTGILSDISDRVHLEEALKRSEERKASLIEGIQDGVAIYDNELRYVECNEAMEAIAGVPRDQMLGHLSFESTPELITNTARALLERALAGESVSTEDLPYMIGDRDEKGYVWARYTPLRNEHGIITGVVGIFSDVTTRKALEREVRESEETLRNVIDAMGDALMISDLQGRVWEVNREFSRLTELPRSEALGVQFPYPWVIDEETAKYVKLITALREENDLRDFDMTWQTKVGRRIPVSLNTTLLRNALGEPVAMLNIARDISDRMRLSQELERKNREIEAQVQRITSLYELGKSLTGALDTQSLLEIVYAEAAKSIPIDGFFYHSVSEKNSALTPVFQAQSGTRATPVNESTAPSYSLVSILESVVEKGESVIVGSETKGSGHASVLAVPMKSKSKSAGVISIVRDNADAFTETHLRILESIANLTEIAIDRARLYEDTVHKSVEIENRNKELDDFTYVVSHDLKEPLISIEGYSKIMLQDYKDKVDAEGREYLSTTVQSANRMKHLIDDLLTLSRVGRVMEQEDTISVGDVIRDVLTELQFTLREKHCEVQVTPDMPIVLFNPTQLSMVFRNLISNAIKFNDKPVPRIEITVTEDKGQYTFSVSDNGIGIDKQYFDKVFVIFQRLQRSEEYRGTGAGLTIVKKIVENHRGRIWIESEPGKGTTFFFTIPKS